MIMQDTDGIRPRSISRVSAYLSQNWQEITSHSQAWARCFATSRIIFITGLASTCSVVYLWKSTRRTSLSLSAWDSILGLEISGCPRASDVGCAISRWVLRHHLHIRWAFPDLIIRALRISRGRSAEPFTCRRRTRRRRCTTAMQEQTWFR